MREPLKLTGVMIVSCALVLIAGALSLGRAVFAPVAFALFTLALVWPLQSRLQVFLPKFLAFVITIVVTTLVITAFGSLIAWGFSRVIRYVINDATRLQALYAQMSDWLETHGIMLAGLWAEHFNVSWLIRLLPGITSRVNGMTTFLVVMLIYVILSLLEVDDAARKLVALKDREIGPVLLAGSAKTAAKFRHYMIVRTLMSIMTGVLVWAFTAATGLELALEWGVIAFALNYIPVIGPLIATVFPTLFAMAQFASWQMTLTVCFHLATAPLRAQEGAPYRLVHDWRVEADRERVLRHLCGDRLDLHLTVGPCAHSRRLTLIYADGSEATIVLDQGFGFLRLVAQPPRFEFQETAAAQAKRLGAIDVSCTSDGTTYLVVVAGG